MISVDSHRADVVGLVSPLAVAELPLLGCLGLVLREHVRAVAPMPGFDNSAMDGYAVRAADIADVPATLPVVADIAAGGALDGELRAGSAARIMTGAPIPRGADCVVQVEFTDGGAQSVRVDRSVAQGTAIRRAGEDVQVGDELLRPGEVVTPGRASLAAAAGRATLAVTRRPRVTIISTGAELRAPGEDLGPGQIYDSNGTALAALCATVGVEATVRACHSDRDEGFVSLVEAAAAESDLVITSGGVSAGVYEVVKNVLGSNSDFVFRRVAMQPGKPQGFGTLSGTAVLCFPGNPVSAFVSFVIFGMPVIRRLAGFADGDLWPQPLGLALAEPVARKAVRQFLRGNQDPDGEAVTPSKAWGSHLVAGLAAADCLIVVPEGDGILDAGSIADVIPLP